MLLRAIPRRTLKLYNKTMSDAAGMPAMQALPGYATKWATVKEGTGDEIVKGATATVHAKGVVKETGKKVRKTLRRLCEEFLCKEVVLQGRAKR